jgi:hypothetical protein
MEGREKLLTANTRRLQMTGIMTAAVLLRVWDLENFKHLIFVAQSVTPHSLLRFLFFYSRKKHSQVHITYNHMASAICDKINYRIQRHSHYKEKNVASFCCSSTVDSSGIDNNL